MSIIEELDLKIRKFISSLFRILILGYSFTIIVFNDNLFSWYAYLVGGIVYYALYLLLKPKRKYFAHLRLLNDYAFFLFVLYGKDLGILLNMGLLLLPIVNSLNHSSHQRPPAFSLPLYLIVLLSLFILNNFEFDYTAIFALLGLAAINIFSFLRASLIRFHTVIYGAIDKFYEENLNLGRAYVLLNNIVESLSSGGSIYKSLAPLDIMCFKVKGTALSLVASSKFISTFSFPNEPAIIAQLRKKSYLRVQDVSINGAVTYNCILILVQGNKAQYVYCIHFSQNSFSFLHPLIIKTVNPLLHKVVKVLEIENDLRVQQRKTLKKLKSKLHYVDNTVKVIHYLNNKLTPVTTYFDLVTKYEQIKDPEILKQLDPLITHEKKRAARGIKDVIGKAHNILDKSLSPYFVEEMAPESFRRIFEIVRLAWDHNDLDVKSIEVGWDDRIYESTMNLNLNDFQLILDEIIDNIKKHSRSTAEVKFVIVEDCPVIRFSNDFKAPANRQDGALKKLVKDFNGNEINEIMKRNSHGTTFIKQFANQMGIKTAFRIDRQLELSMIFPVNNA
ncbi:hypothetical protein I2I11_20715 [Pontibacter sp. 172403-2]|uniref:hypothetical protein n=1 Tax=Pontibacter rufus TaxID=2791028 RepID=UPI0018AFF6DB|nr:hypothetical protein [Pontibacter sp. 172403-2]MBF9255733.1 hypothetical protein [Pontibacter sp. 172403-2]